MTLSIEREQVERFRVLVANKLGLNYDDGKLDHLADVLRQRMTLVGSRHFEAYWERLLHPKSSAESREIPALADLLTVNETFFFRNPEQYRAFAELVLPERIRARAGTKRLRLLSAGCASGEEAYSLAVFVREALPELESWDVEILGIDVSPAILDKAKQGRYSAWSLRATPEDAKRQYFRTDGASFVLVPRIKEMVTFGERNLVVEDPLFWRSLGCDVVFCRNMLMYLTPEKALKVVEGITEGLVPGGYLFLGHAETLRGISSEFHLRHTHGTFYYQLRAASEIATDTVAWISPLREQAQSVLASEVAFTDSWVEVIQQASERIASLIDQPSPSTDLGVPSPAKVAASPIPSARTRDLGLVLEAMRQERFSYALELIGSQPVSAEVDVDALLLRAVLLTNDGRVDESEEACRRLLVLDELSAGAHYLLALCREHAGDAAAAIEHEQTATYLDAAFAMPHLHLGIMAKRAGDVATAQRELAQASLLLAREDASRLLLFGGGFSRETLLQLCRTELRAAGGER